MDHDTSPAGAPLVPGLVLGPLLGRGAHGSVWQARDAVTGDLVAVKVGRRPDDARAAREAALLARVDHPHVVRLRNVVECPDGTRALVLDLAEGGSLADLVAARGPLSAGETVTVAVGLARTLADLHGLGLVHGDLTPGNVLLTSDGRPLVADLGVSGVLGVDADRDVWGTPGFADPADGPATDPARDVHALGALVRFCLTGAAAGADPGPAPDAGTDALLALADLATDVDPARRPDAAEVARLAWAAAAPQPLRLGGASPAGAPDAHGPDRVRGRLVPSDAPDDAARSHRDVVTAALLGRDAAPNAADVTRRIRQSARSEADRRRTAADAAAERRRARVRRAARTGGVLAGAVVVGGAVALAATTWLVDAPAPARRPDDAPQARPGPAPTTAPTHGATRSPGTARTVDVARTVERLAAARARALRAGTVAALGAVDEPGSAAFDADRALLARLSDAGVRLEGLRFTVSGVRVVRGDDATVTVEARVTTAAHRQVRADGTVVRRVPAASAQRVRLVLVGTPSGWRVRSVAAV